MALMALSEVAEQLEALGNRNRLKIYRILVNAGQRGISVDQLQERLGTRASTLSHHLQKLIRVVLVTQERQGTMLICRANYVSMDRLISYLTDEAWIEQDASGSADVV